MAKRVAARCNDGQDIQGIVRVPVSRNHIIAAMSGKFVCRDPDCNCRHAMPHFEQAFYDSIVKMLYKICRKYTVGCPKDDLNDLVQLSFRHIIQKLSLFNPESSRFTTWTWTVCRNLMIHHFHSAQRHGNTFVELDGKHDFGVADRDSQLYKDMVKATRHLTLCNPEWKDVIGEIFGDFRKGDFNPSFCISKIARKTRRRYSDVYAFVRDIVRPQFAEVFQTMEI